MAESFDRIVINTRVVIIEAIILSMSPYLLCHPFLPIFKVGRYSVGVGAGGWVIPIWDTELVNANATTYASIQFWYRLSLKTAEITSDGIKAIVEFRGEGSAKAPTRDKCGHGVLSASELLRITLQENSIT
ncbi:hypothetical protein B0T25DRAFT_609049 [Lasiosphaeria hispida]|uniref:Uncharacterized protein n=1 Tax=Lasiosphaeria hispida TaxID=260671 RepID=A0AAJ0MBP8_9PEZI|nr:hypothetical protein B0T25DRAFT_609049 [Lasiosphaeria hispida]